MDIKDQVTTPMMKQFLEIKGEHPDEILFFRMGDFYEMFFADAERAAAILDITLTSRDGGNGIRVPMAGVPHHSSEGYLQRLIEAGERVAICEQIGDPKGKGLVAREVTRVITPGARLDSGVMGSREDNFAAALAGEAGTLGMAVADISTGYFACFQVSGERSREQLLAEFARLKPRECLLDPSLDEEDWSRDLHSLGAISFPRISERSFEEKTARRTLTRHFGTRDLAGYGCEDKSYAVKAAGALLDYLSEMQGRPPAAITGLRTYSLDDYLSLDPVARRTLEITEPLFADREGSTLLETLDGTRTSMGGRLLRRWMERPLRDIDAIERRLDAVERLVSDAFAREALGKALEGMADLERLVGRVSAETANPRDMVALREGLDRLPNFVDVLDSLSDDASWAKIAEQMDTLEDVREELGDALADEPPTAISDGGIIRDGYSDEVDELRILAADGRGWVAGLEGRERERTGIKSLKVGYNKVFGYYIEVTHPNRDLVPEDYIRKQTLVNSERYITPELKEKEADILGAQDRLAELEYAVFCALRSRIALKRERMQATTSLLARMDVFLSWAETAARRDYCRPVVDESGDLSIVAGRHPVLERTEPDFVPNDCELDPLNRAFAVITGPNMSGKSTYLRQVALITVMAQMGCFVPARSARIGRVDRIFTRIGAADDLTRGRSTFMVEMTEVADILNNATPRSLVILDEVGRGTSTFDGISIAWATCEYLRLSPGLGCRTLFATHYHELTRLAEFCPGVFNCSVAVREDGEDVVFLRKVVPGPSDESYGIHVARLAGLPRAALGRAREILDGLEEISAVPEVIGEVSDSPYLEEMRGATTLQQASLFADSGAGGGGANDG